MPPSSFNKATTVDSISAVLITKSLDCLAMRLKVNASNVANASSTGFRPSRVSFEEDLKTAASRGMAAINDVQPRIERMPVGRFGDEPRLDLELDTAVATAGRYAALVGLLSREMDIMRTAVKGGQ